MFDFIFKSPIWQVIALSDWISKYVILLGLLFLSIICVAIIIAKALSFAQHKRRLNLLMKKMAQVKNLSDCATLSKDFRGSLGGMLLHNGLTQLKTMLDSKGGATDASESVKLTINDLDHLELLMRQDAEGLLTEEESYVPFLGISASVSPLIGLFGTIWGLVRSFVNISQEKSADITTVAPGIASALMTTLAGLVVAIPAVVAFHYFSGQVRLFETKLDHISDLFIMMVQRQLCKEEK